MTEFKRVFCNKKIIISFMLIVTICLSLFLFAQYQSVWYSECNFEKLNSYREDVISELSDKSISQAQKEVSEELNYTSTILSFMNFERIKKEDINSYLDIWQNEESKLRQTYPEIAQEYDDNKASYKESEYIAKEVILSEISSQIEHIIDYPDYLNSINLKSEQMNEISIFSDSSSDSNANIKKTASDYANLKYVNLELGNDKTVTSVVSFELIHYLIFLLNLTIVIAFIQERKSGLWSIIHSTKKGRFILAFERIGILTAGVVLSTVIMYIVLFAASFILYGGTEVFRSIQSISEFKNFVFPMSVLEFIIFYVFVNILSQLVLILFVYLIITLVREINIAVGIIGIILVSEYVLYRVLPIQSNFSVLKCINLFCFFNPTTEIMQYHNLNLFGIVINRFWMMFYSLIVLTLIFGFLTILISACKYPESNENRITIVFNRLHTKLSSYYWRVVENFSTLGYELYKLLIIKKGWIVLTAFVFILFNSVNTTEVHINEADSIVDEFYDKYSGKLSDDALEYTSNLKNQIDEADAELAQAYMDYKEGKISQDSYDYHTLKSEAFDGKREALSIIQSRISYAEEQGENGWLVNPNGYSELLSTDGFQRQQNFALLSIFCITIILSSVFAFEKQSMVYPVLMSTSKGRNSLFRKKMLSAIIITMAIWICTGFVELITVGIRYPLNDLSAPINSLEFMNEIPVNLSIIEFIIGLYIFRLILMMSVSGVVCFFSTFGKYEVSLLISTILLIVPSLIYLVGVEFVGYISVVPPLSAMKMLLTSNTTTLVFQFVVITACGIISIMLAKRKWCNERR